MRPAIFLAICILSTLGLMGGSWRLAQSERVQETAEQFSRNREFILGIGVLAAAGTIYTLHISVEGWKGTPIDTTITQQAIWASTIALISLYTHIKLFAAYSEYQNYPDLPDESYTTTVWLIYRRWTYLTRNDFKCIILSATIAMVLAFSGFALGIPLWLCSVLGGYHLILTGISTHGSKFIDYQKEKRLLFSPEGNKVIEPDSTPNECQ